MEVDRSRLVAAGRASEVFDLGDGTVLRRALDGTPSEREAAAMRWAGAHGVTGWSPSTGRTW